MVHIFVVSDGTGMTAKPTQQAALTQFPSKEYKINSFPKFCNQEKIHQILNLAIQKQLFNTYTIISNHFKNIDIPIIKIIKIKIIYFKDKLLIRWLRALNNIGQRKLNPIYRFNRFNFRKFQFTDYPINSPFTLKSRGHLSIYPIKTIY